MGALYLDHLDGEHAGRNDHFDEGVVAVGRAEECALRFTEKGVSWAHAELRLKDDGWWVIDKGSTNGTYVNDERADKAKLCDGDLVRFGKKGPVLRVGLGSEPPAKSPDKPPANPEEAVEEEGEAAVTGSPAGSPAGRASGRAAVAPRPSGRAAVAKAPHVATAPVGPEEAKAALQRPIDPNEAHSDLPPAAMFEEGGGGGFGWGAAIVAGLLLMGTSSMLGKLWLDTVDLQEELDGERDLRMRRERALEQLKAKGTEGSADELAAQALELRRTREELDDAERLLRESQRELDLSETEHLEERSELQRELERTRSQLRLARAHGSNEGEVDWDAVERRTAGSTFRIVVEFLGQPRDGGEPIPYRYEGTGFMISASGHVLASKRVVEPWKYRPLAEDLAREHIAVVPGSAQVHAWPLGAPYTNEDGEPDLSTAYSTVHEGDPGLGRRPLEIVRRAEDRWESVALGGEHGARMIRVHQDHAEEALVLLKVSGYRIDPPLLPGPSGGVGALDDALVVQPELGEGSLWTSGTLRVQLRRSDRGLTVAGGDPASSLGAPVVDRRGRVVAVIHRFVEDEGGMALCVPIEHALRLVYGGTW